MAERNFLVRVDGKFVRNTLGRLITFTEAGAHRWVRRRRPQSYSVVRLSRG